MFNSVNKSLLCLFGCFGINAAVNAAVIRVPADIGDIEFATALAASGDEIRVANTHTEVMGFAEVTNKNIKIISYSPDYTTPSPGAKWESYDPDKNIEKAIMKIENSTVEIEGFSSIKATDFNAFYLNSNSTLILKNSHINGVSLADTAAVKSPANAQNIVVRLTDSSINNGGRAFWLRGLKGTTELSLTNSEILNNVSWPIEYRSLDGIHKVNFINSSFTVTGIAGGARPIRLFLFGAAEGTTTKNDILIDSCRFTLNHHANAGQMIMFGGVNRNGDSGNHSPESHANWTIQNSIFDSRLGGNSNANAPISHQDDDSAQAYKRLSTLTMNHCTILVDGNLKPGIRTLEVNSVANISNTIIDGNGSGGYALRGWRGTINSKNNLLNTSLGVSQTSTGGSVLLNGQEIVDNLAGFVKFKDLAGGDFRLEEDSPARNAGSTDIVLAYDIAGNPRPSPIGSNPDIGAYETTETSGVSNWMIY